MSDKTVQVMKEHLLIAEEYIKALKAAETKKEMLNAMNRCTEAVKRQYPDLEEISDDYGARIHKGDKELKEISVRVGDIYGKEITGLYGKMGRFMADSDFMEALGSIDIVIGSNPLFGANEFGADVAVEVSKTIAGSLDAMATKMIADTTETGEDTLNEIAGMMEGLLDLSKRYVARVNEAGTARKVVTATEAFVDAIRKLVPQMRKHADQLKLIMAKDNKPEKLMRLSAELSKVLGDQLKQAMRDKEELFREQKVQKAVAKLGEVLNEVPF